jgi:hypothetical protein
MDFKFFIKLLAAIFVIFGLFFSAMIIYPKIILHYNAALLESDNPDDRLSAFKYLARSGEKGHQIIVDFCRKNSDYGWGKKKGQLRCRIYSPGLPGELNLKIRLLGLAGEVIIMEISNCENNDVYVEYRPLNLAREIKNYVSTSPGIQINEVWLKNIISARLSHSTNDEKEKAWIEHNILKAHSKADFLIAETPSDIYDTFGEGIYYISFYRIWFTKNVGNQLDVYSFQLESNKVCFAIISEK